MANLRPLLQSYLDSQELPPHGALLSLLEGGISALEGESGSYRPRDDGGVAGGLLDFTSGGYAALPLVVVPDLHARGQFLLDILDFHIDGRSVLELLEGGGVMVCCVGDIFHSEHRARERWMRAFMECQGGNFVSEPMRQEMRENLSLLEMVLSLKSAFTSHFHILKGNHENVLNESCRAMYGNVPFRKFCDEGNMVADFLRHQYDDLILHEIACFEKSLPVCAAFAGCVVSHAEPACLMSRDEIIGYHKDGSRVSLALTWTANGDAEDGTVAHLLAELLPEEAGDRAVYFSGHRPVTGKYALRQGGRLIQIHNPDAEQVAVVRAGRRFDPESDIVNVGAV